MLDHTIQLFRMAASSIGSCLTAYAVLCSLQVPPTVDPIMPCSTPCTPCKSSSPFSCSTSTSNSSMTWTTTLRDSKKPFTATRSMRFVVALYSVLKTVLSSSLPAFCPASLTRVNERRTRGESSSSTASELRVVSARRWVGKGVLIVLVMSQYMLLESAGTVEVQGARKLSAGASHSVGV